jgi:hypothetical protein
VVAAAEWECTYDGNTVVVDIGLLMELLLKLSVLGDGPVSGLGQKMRTGLGAAGRSWELTALRLGARRSCLLYWKPYSVEKWNGSFGCLTRAALTWDQEYMDHGLGKSDDELDDGRS